MFDDQNLPCKMLQGIMNEHQRHQATSCQSDGSGCALVLQERVEALRGQLDGQLESAVLNCCAFTSSVAAQQLLESAMVKRVHRCAVDHLTSAGDN